MEVLVDQVVALVTIRAGGVQPTTLMMLMMIHRVITLYQLYAIVIPQIHIRGRLIIPMRRVNLRHHVLLGRAVVRTTKLGCRHQHVFIEFTILIRGYLGRRQVGGGDGVAAVLGDVVDGGGELFGLVEF